MHALRHVHRLVRPGGTMIDIHPVTEERLEAARRELGVIREPSFVEEDLPNAEARLADAVRAGLYAPEAEEEFDVRQHFDSPEELLEARQEALADQPQLRRLIAAATPPLVTTAHVVARRFRILPSRAV